MNSAVQGRTGLTYHGQSPTTTSNPTATHLQGPQVLNSPSFGTYNNPTSQPQGLALTSNTAPTSSQVLQARQAQSYGTVSSPRPSGNRGTVSYRAPAQSYSVSPPASALHGASHASQPQPGEPGERLERKHNLIIAAATPGQHPSYPSRITSMPSTTIAGCNLCIPPLSQC